MPYVRAPVAAFWEQDSLRCISGVTGREVDVSPEILAVLNEASRPLTAMRLASKARVPVSVIRSLIELGLLMRSVESPSLEEESRWLEYWSSLELAVQRRAARGRRCPGFEQRAMPPPLRRHHGHHVGLPPVADSEGADLPFSKVLSARRSYRSFAEEPVSLEELSRLLNGVGGIRHIDFQRGVSYRPSPSGGGRHSVEMYLVPLRVEGLPLNAYHFQPLEGDLIALENTGELAEWVLTGLSHALTPSAERIIPPALVLLLTTYTARTLWKYENMGLLAVHKDVGAVLQTLYLQATALGLGGFAIGGGPADRIASQLGLDPVVETYVAAFAAGKIAMDGG